MAATDPLYRDLILRLVQAREAAHLTQSAVATSLGRPQSFVSKYESGERRLDAAEFARICLVLGAKPASLLQEAVRATASATAKGHI